MPAKKYFQNFLFNKPFSVKSLNQVVTSDENISYPILKEFGVNSNINFHVLDWHEYFDALLGSEDLRKLGAKINYNDQTLQFGSIKIPFFIELNPKNFQPLKQNFRNYLNIPVNIDDGPVIIPEMYVNNVYIPESIANSKNGFCIIPFDNENEIEVNFHQQIKVQPITSVAFDEPEYYSSHLDFTKIIRTEHLNVEEKFKIISLCKQYKDIFYNENSKLTFSNAIKHKIRTVDDEPVFCRPFRYPYHLKHEIQVEVQKLLNNDIIRPSISPYSSPVWIVPKKFDSSGRKNWRLVIDFRKLNQKTVEDKYPLPRIDDILDNLGKCTYFSTLDLAQGFHQIEMDPASIEKTAFTVNNGHFEYTRMPFGLKNAPSTFQRAMENIVREYLYKFCFVYMDDIVVFSKSLHDHILHLTKIFEKFRQFNLKMQINKSEFLRKEVVFLGHIITPDGIKPNPAKTKAIEEYPIPKTTKEIKSFLGLLGFYRKFIPNFAKIVQPLTKCLKKGSKIDVNDSSYQQAFYQSKELLVNAPILSYPDFSQSFCITTDASNVAVAGVLSQNNKPISFYSRTLNSSERMYSTIERELLAIVESTKHFRPYIYGRPFIVECDQKPLVWLFSLKDPNSRLVKWRLRLEEFDFEIRYKKGKENVVADALSRIEINTKETLNQDDDNDDDLDLLSVLPNIDMDEDLTALEYDEILSTGPTNDLDESDEQSINTQHTSAENPVFTIPISDNSINNFKNRIVLKLGDKYNVSYSRPFQKHHYVVSIRRGQERENILQMLKEITNPNALYGVYFDDKIIESQFCKLSKELFDSKVRFIKSSVLANDVTKPDEQYRVINEYHQTNHNGVTETFQNLKQRFFWPDMKIKINKIINECETCLISKYERHPYKIKFSGPLLSKRPFDIIHIDIFSFEGNKFLTIIDLFSRYTQAYFIEDTSGITILNKLRHYFSHHGFPRKIVSDEGKEFKNKVYQEFCDLFKIQTHFTTNYNSSSNSPVERVHSTLLEKLRTIKSQNNNETPQNNMISAVLTYNQSIHSTTGYTPFTLLYGPYENLNSNAIDLNKTIYETYNQKRKNEILPFYEELYQKQLEKATRNLEKRNQDKEHSIEINEPTVYFKRQRIRKTDPAYDKVNVTSIKDNKIEGTREISNRPANIHTRKIKRLKKTFSLQDVPDQSEPGPSNRES